MYLTSKCEKVKLLQQTITIFTSQDTFFTEKKHHHERINLPLKLRMSIHQKIPYLK